ncbi:MAG: poly-gamma-glutamate hydrolase family protein [Acidimicrobiia bacterium]|nr:poly-gamma-glutamate hydrolase family protein [Acidimicrobiia bacterium]
MQDVDRTPITFAELLARPGVVEIVDLKGPIGFCAFHGGNLERVTEQIASEAAARSGSSFYGVIQPRGMRHHIPSTLVDPTQSPKLAAFVAHCRWVIAVHGYGLQGHFASLLCGGGNRYLASHVARHIRDALPAYETIDDIDRIPRSLRGLHPDNPCNLTTGGGMQLELPPRVRGLTPLVLAWPSHNPQTQRFPHVNHLIDGLIQAAGSWTRNPDPPCPTGQSPMGGTAPGSTVMS